MKVIQAFYLCIITGICALTDIRERKIKNGWLAAAVLGAFFFMAVRGNERLVIDGLAVMFLTFVILYPLYLLRMIGAGDVKLLCVVGCYIGWKEMAVFVVGTGCLCVIVTVWKLVYYQNMRRRLAYFWNYVRCLCFTKTPGIYGIPKNKEETIGMAVPVFGGTVIWFIIVYVMK